MAKTNKAAFPQDLNTGTAVTTAVADTATDAPANTALLLTAGPEGTAVGLATLQGRGTYTAGLGILYVSDDGGTTMRPIRSIKFEAETVSATEGHTNLPFADITATSPLNLQAGETLHCGTTVASGPGFSWRAEGRDY